MRKRFKKPKDTKKIFGSSIVVAISVIVIVIVVLLALITYNIIPTLTQDDVPYALFIADTHIGRGEGEKNLRIAVNCINKMDPQPEFVMVGGDLTDWGEGVSGNTNYERFLAEMNRLDCKWYVIPGNHDYRHTWQITPPYSLDNYDNHFSNHDDYVFNLNDYCFIALDTGPDNWELELTPQGTGLTNTQMFWLETNLDMLDGVQDNQDTSNKVKIIFMHHPAMDKGNDGDGCIGNNRENFIDLCDKYNVYAVMAGHTHKDINLDYKGIDYSLHKSGTQFTTTLSVLESVGYRKIILDSSELPTVLEKSQSFDWESAVNNPVGDYYGDKEGEIDA
jgi:3',5'-cyclic AMP phosphodiesterase CpdA